MNTTLTSSDLTQMEQVIIMWIAIVRSAAKTLDFAQNLNIPSQNHTQGVEKMKLIKTLTAIILTEIIIAIPVLVGIYVWSMVAFV